MKQYKKTYEDAFKAGRKRVQSLDKISSPIGTTEELAQKFRDFYREAYKQLFYIAVCQVWLEQQFIYDGKRRSRRWSFGHQADIVYGFFMKEVVGISQKPITGNRLFTAVSSYFKEFFPEFLSHDPFEEPDYFLYPFKHVTLDQMFFVYMCHERMEMLRYSEEREMNYLEFVNWATNHVLSYNEDVREDIYYISIVDNIYPVIRSKKYDKFKTRDDLFNFEKNGRNT